VNAATVRGRRRVAAILAALLAGAAGASCDDAPPSAWEEYGSGPYADEPPVAHGDHWHAAFGVNVCGEWMDDVPEFHNRADTPDRAGLHSHGDGFVHVHPYADDEAGSHATLGRFVEYGGWELSEHAFRLWDGEDHRDGDECDGVPARVRWSVDGRERAGDPAAYPVQDGDVIALAFLPEGEPIGTPPSASRVAPRSFSDR
jgi:hypothetical protein